MSRRPVLVTCEHGGNRVPARYASLFVDRERLLRSHRGWDPGALPLARHLARGQRAPLRYSTVTRLLVDLNRSEESPEVFSEVSAGLPAAERRRILRRYHRRYRSGVLCVARALAGRGPLVHLSVHTFTPVLDRAPRSVDIGVLFDPGRQGERDVSERWIEELERERPDLRIRPNAPYRGVDDGLTSWLRGEIEESTYAGIELEVSQGLARGALGETRVRHPPSCDARYPGAALVRTFASAVAGS